MTIHLMISMLYLKKISYTMGEIIAKHGKSQVRIAETEKYHPVIFFNGGNEKFSKRILPISRKSQPYDLKPEMSA